MGRSFILGLFSFLICMDFALATPATRLPGQDFKKLVEKFRPRQNTRGTSAYDAAEDLDKLDVSKAPEEKRIEEVFNYLRDHRELVEDDDPTFLRRITWLYPADGCWLRATVAGHWATRQGYATPSRLFIFGNLGLDTPNDVNHHVTWWYHVAPVLKNAQGKLMVMDPAIDPSHPLTVEEWVKPMLPSLKYAQVSLCSSHTFEPFDDCATTTSPNESKAEAQIAEYLVEEKENLVELNRDPKEELGEHPPWKPR